jgi:hypothetical protein
VLDLSATGLRIRTLAVLGQEDVLEGTLEAKGRSAPVKAVVVWFEPGDYTIGLLPEAGLQVVDPSAEYLDLVASVFADGA